MDITDLILDDHHRQRQAFARLDSLDSTDALGLRLLWGELAQFLERHAAAEEAVFYPQLLHLADPDGKQTKDAIGDHNDIRRAVADSANYEVASAKWWAAVGQARTANTEHMGEEEDEGLADFRKRVTLEQRHSLGILFEMAKSDPAAPNLDMTDKDPVEYVAHNG
jgi:Hemerythrin HHE cation binding domain